MDTNNEFEAKTTDEPTFIYAVVGPSLHQRGFSTMPATGKAAFIPGWSQFNNRLPTDAEVTSWCAQYGDCNTGLLPGPASGVVGVDIDILDLVLADIIDAIARETLGATPAIRIGQAPKQLRLYRGDGIASRKVHPIEIFGDSGQFVVYGVHPVTQQPYQWIDAQLVDLTPAELPVVTETMVQHFLQEAARVLPPTVRRVGERSRAAAGNPACGIFDQLREERRGKRGQQWLDVLARQLAEAQPTTLHNVMISTAAALVLRGYSDSAIHNFIDEHFAAPRSGPYAEVWAQINDAIVGARRRFNVPQPTSVPLEP